MRAVSMVMTATGLHLVIDGEQHPYVFEWGAEAPITDAIAATSREWARANSASRLNAGNKHDAIVADLEAQARSLTADVERLSTLLDEVRVVAAPAYDVVQERRLLKRERGAIAEIQADNRLLVAERNALQLKLENALDDAERMERELECIRENEERERDARSDEPQWEYKTEALKNTDWDLGLNQLNEQGADGWRFVAAVGAYAYFERRKGG